MDKCADLLLLGFDHSNDIPVLIVGRRDDKQVSVINAYQGEEALDLYYRLTGKECRDVGSKDN